MTAPSNNRNMAFFDRMMDLFCDHAAVVNDDPAALEKEVEIVKREFGPWVRVKGFTSFRQFFLALHVASAKKCPFSIAFIQDEEEEAGELVLKKSDPTIKTIKYSDSRNLTMMLPAAR